MVDISKRLAQAITESGMSYVELEKKTKIAKSSIQRYATGATKKIPIDAVKSIADATRTSAAWIMGWESSAEATKNDIITDIILRLRKDDDFLKVTETIMNLPEEQFAAVQTMLSVIK